MRRNSERWEVGGGGGQEEYLSCRSFLTSVELLAACLHERKSVETFDTEQGGHQPYQYEPEPEYAVEPHDPTNPMETMRFPHKTYFRPDYKG
jgi:hypothetical protein